MRTEFGVVIVSAVALLAACAPVTKKEKEDLAKPIECNTAEGDIRVLKSEKDSVAKRIAEGVAGIAPAGIVVVTDSVSTSMTEMLFELKFET